MNFVLLRTSGFVRDAKRLIAKNPDVVPDLEAALGLLSQDPHHPALKTHRLTGTLAGSLACSAGYDLRIIFNFTTHDRRTAIVLRAIGTHEEVY
jgi:mRNA-degrading endonuclease YafQ of YafQ-DinJ toxin-antitoxin module